MYLILFLPYLPRNMGYNYQIFETIKKKKYYWLNERNEAPSLGLFNVVTCRITTAHILQSFMPKPGLSVFLQNAVLTQKQHCNKLL